MDPLDLAVVTRHPETWAAVRAAFDTWRPEASADGIEREGVGILKPDFGPGYRIRALQHTGDAAALTGWLDRHRPPYAVAFVMVRGMPGKHLGLGDVVISNAIPGFDWAARVGRGAGSGAESEARVDNNLLRGALGLDAVDQRWTRQTRAPRPDGTRAPRLMAGGVASTVSPVPDERGFDDDQIRAITRRWPKLVAVETEGLDLATSVSRSEGRPRVAMLASVLGLLPDPDSEAGQAAMRYATSNAASFLRCWIRHAWPTRPASADTGQTPKGIRLGDEAIARRSTTDSLPQIERTTSRAEDRSESRPPRGVIPRTMARGGIISRTERDAARSAERGESFQIVELDVAGQRQVERPEATRRRGTGELGEHPGSGPVSLRARLARLYPTADDARRVMRDAKLPLAVLDSSVGPDGRWHKILEYARQDPEGVQRLLDVLARDEG